VGGDSDLDRKEQEMRKTLSIALVVLVALGATATAQADSPQLRSTIAAENADSSATRSPVGQIVAQERGRSSDPRLFYPSGPAPVQVVGPADRFDMRDAGVGAAAVLALTCLAASAFALRGSRRLRTASAES
jgi:hypothetical protein